MPRVSGGVPTYRHHRSTGNAVVTLAGRDHYLGKFGSKASKQLYDRLVAEWLAGGRQSAPIDRERGLLVKELILQFWRFAQQHYRRKNGEPTQSAERFKPVMRLLKTHYGNTPAAEFGPKRLKAIRQHMLAAGMSRGTINDEVGRIRRIFKWAVSEELIDESIHRALTAVSGLRQGLTDAPEGESVKPVDNDVVESTLPHLNDVVCDMVQFARHTGARPNEVCLLRPRDIDRSRDVWLYVPSQHKTERHQSRTIPIGPKAQAILQPYLGIERDPDCFCFVPSEAVERHRQQKHARRKTPLSCGERPGSRLAKRKGRKSKQSPLGERYTPASFRRAIHRACDRAFPPPAPLACRSKETAAARDRRLTTSQQQQLEQWQSDHRWAPNQLRHTAGTLIRDQFDIESAAAVLGHSKIETTQIYAETSLRKAIEVARAVG